MGKDEHNGKSKKPLGQTPKHQQVQAKDVEFAEEIADSADFEAQRRAAEAEERTRQEKHNKRRSL
ncbi:hypothetical protein ABID56_002481 [Alkalibacillus flavidus]|uniref:YfhD family protein n=1 Tax=Alkalibacillus flavidus TaxID=546021 RepID=A0ABV2KY77_9BACI